MAMCSADNNKKGNSREALSLNSIGDTSMLECSGNENFFEGFLQGGIWVQGIQEGSARRSRKRTRMFRLERHRIMWTRKEKNKDT